MHPQRLGIIGLGAVGGSLALRASSLGLRVSGYSRIPAESSRAARAGALRDIALSAEDLLRSVDLLVLCAPPRANVELLGKLAKTIRKKKVLVTDVSSVKGPITEAAKRLGLTDQFVGSHPLCNPRGTGFGSAQSDLLRNALVYVATESGGDEVAREIGHFWETICEASVVYVPSQEHDRIMGSIAHLPHVASSALAICLSRMGERGATFSPAAKDAIRLGGGGNAMWSDVLVANREALMTLLDGLGTALDEARELIGKEDRAGLEAWLKDGVDFSRSARDE
jgi:prephenate dehydrogenase